jgi:Zn-dependent peptidase ImmA (M78 family)
MFSRANDERGYQLDYDADERHVAQKANIKVAVAIARGLLKTLRIMEPPVAIDDIVRERGLIVKKAEVPGMLSGQLYPEVREIFINTRGRAVVRQRFTLAHELGHWELRHYERTSVVGDELGFDGPYGDPNGRPAKNPIEVEANVFAAELLMPTSWIRKLNKPLQAGEPDRLAELYQVSREAMFYQLMSCRMM